MLILFLIFTIYILCGFLLLKNKKKNLLQVEHSLFLKFDERFNIFETLIEAARPFVDYEQTFLNEIVKSRIRAKKFKQNGEKSKELQQEELISYLSKQIELLFKEFPKLYKIEDPLKHQENILKIEHELSILKKEYFTLINEYNNLRKSPICYLLSFFIPPFEPEDTKF